MATDARLVPRADRFGFLNLAALSVELVPPSVESAGGFCQKRVNR